MPTPVSVLVPAYNGARYLPETLDSIFTQEYQPAEVIVVDDGSQDDTREVIARFGTRVRYHYSQNGGICHARNLAASLATQPYLAFCDQDDLWRPDKLAQQMGMHDAHPDLDYSFTNFSLMVDGVALPRTKLDDAPANFFQHGLPDGSDTPVVYPHGLYDSLLEFQPIWPSTVVITKRKFEALGQFLEELGKNPSEDFEFSLRCVREGPIGIVRQPVVNVRRHGTNYSSDNEKNTRGQIDILLYVLQHHAIPEETRQKVLQQIDLRRVEASYSAFRRSDFEVVRSLLSPVSGAELDRKTRLKLWIAKQPPNVAKVLQKILLRG